MIPATHSEIEQIYLAAEMSQSRSLCITACQSGDGVTSVATALAERYLLAGLKTLIVDLNTFHPAFESAGLVSNALHAQCGVLLEHKESHQLFTGLPVPSQQAELLSYRDPAQLSVNVESWLNDFDRVICDTSPLLQINRSNIPAQVVANACDHTILVVMGGKTTSGQLSKATELLSHSSIQLLGSVLNLQHQATLGQEMVRELNRLTFLPKRWREKLCNRILANDLLAHSA